MFAICVIQSFILFHNSASAIYQNEDREVIEIDTYRAVSTYVIVSKCGLVLSFEVVKFCFHDVFGETTM